MDPLYISLPQPSQANGSITTEQLSECRYFVKELLHELNKQKVVLILHNNIAEQFRPEIAKCNNLIIQELSNLDPNTHHQLRCSSDVVLARAIRDVSSAQLALSGQPTIHTICPTHGDYMGEWKSTLLAANLGIAIPFSVRNDNLSDILSVGVEEKVTQRAFEIAKKFSKERGVTYLLNLLKIN